MFRALFDPSPMAIDLEGSSPSRAVQVAQAEAMESEPRDSWMPCTAPKKRVALPHWVPASDAPSDGSPQPLVMSSAHQIRPDATPPAGYRVLRSPSRRLSESPRRRGEYRREVRTHPAHIVRGAEPYVGHAQQRPAHGSAPPHLAAGGRTPSRRRADDHLADAQAPRPHTRERRFPALGDAGIARRLRQVTGRGPLRRCQQPPEPPPE